MATRLQVRLDDHAEPHGLQARGRGFESRRLHQLELGMSGPTTDVVATPLGL